MNSGMSVVLLTFRAMLKEIMEKLQNFHGKFTELAGALKYLSDKS